MPEEKQELVKQPERLLVADDGEFSMYMDTAKFEHGQRVANLLATSSRIPDCYKNKPADCFLALQMSTRLNMDPVMFMQKSYVVHGKAGIEAQLVIALMNTRGPFKGPVQWKFSGEDDTRSCTAYATHKVTDEVCEATVSMKMVKAEGWYSKPGSKWKTLPDLMFQYRSASFLCNLYCPEVKMGFTTIEEIQDMGPGKGVPLPEANVSPLEGRLKQVENVADRPAPPIPPKVEDVVPDMPDFEKEPEKTERTRRSRCRGCNELFPGSDLIPTTNGPLCVSCNEPKTYSDPIIPPAELEQPPQPPQPESNGVGPEERWFCKDCDAIFAKPAGGGLDLCRACLGRNIIDRWKPVE